MSRPPLPPFTAETAAEKARMAEDAWNTRDPAKVALAYTPDSRWRNRAELLQGREAIEAFLTRKWSRELDYRLIKEVWTYRENRIAVRFACEWCALVNYVAKYLITEERQAKHSPTVGRIGNGGTDGRSFAPFNDVAHPPSY
jgi:uncharacterized protein (TIGR02246 family)